MLIAYSKAGKSRKAYAIRLIHAVLRLADNGEDSLLEGSIEPSGSVETGLKLATKSKHKGKAGRRKTNESSSQSESS